MTQNISDVDHIIGGDLSWSSTGDLLLSELTVKGQQRVLRRLITNSGAYKWHPTYGSGIGLYVGSISKINEIKSTIRGQMRMEAAVMQTPPPVINASYISQGVSVDIQYVDADEKRPVSLFFDVNK